MGKHIILIGPMGAGKSSLGKRLAKRLKRPFYDCDQYLEERTGVSITTIFELEGEQGFRQREHKIFAELLAQDCGIIATGGGIVTQSVNHTLLADDENSVVYLKASVASQQKRTSHDKSRPLLQTPNRHAKLVTLATQRNPLYEKFADIIVDTDRQNIGKSIEQIISQLEQP